MHIFTGAIDAVELNRADFAALYPAFLHGKNDTIGFALREIKLFCDIFGDKKSFINRLVVENNVTETGVIPIFEVTVKFDKPIKVPTVDGHDITVSKQPYEETDCTGMFIVFTKNIFQDGFRMFLQHNSESIQAWRWSYAFAKRENGAIADQLCQLIERPLKLKAEYGPK